jgi:hypothetical protein
MPDWWELRYGLDIGVNNAALDSDFDGHSDFAEYLSGGNPLVDDRFGKNFDLSPLFEADTGGRNGDTDADGLPDWWERFYFNNDTTAARLADPDGDHHTNFEEFLAGTDPLDRRSILSITEIRTASNSAVIRWSSVPSHTYSLWKADERDLTFRAIASNLLATPPINSFTNATTSSRDIYRVGASR